MSAKKNVFTVVKFSNFFNFQSVPLFLIISFILLFGYRNSVSAQEEIKNETDISMFFNNDQKYINKVEATNGNLWDEMGHHGPAIENLWAGYRIFFEKRCAIDLYNKVIPRLELKKNKWYSSDSLVNIEFGSDNFWVGNSIGAGSIRLWESDSVKMLYPVTNRVATVTKEGSISQIDFLSEGIPYNNSKVDILIRLTVFSGYRHAKVEAFALTDIPVQFVTGLNFNPNVDITVNNDNIITWGSYSEHKTNIEVGVAVIFRKDSFIKKTITNNEHLFISKPTKYLSTWITTASELEKEINNLERFKKYVNSLTLSLLK